MTNPLPRRPAATAARQPAATQTATRQVATATRQMAASQAAIRQVATATRQMAAPQAATRQMAAPQAATRQVATATRRMAAPQAATRRTATRPAVTRPAVTRPAVTRRAAIARSGRSRSDGLELSPLTSSLGYLLRRLQLAYKKHFLREARSTNLQPRLVGAMYVVGLNPGVTPSQMSAALGLDAVHTALMLNALEARGLITRRLSSTDGRSRVVHLTPAGKKTFAKLQIVATRVEQDFVSGALTQQETAQLISLMTRLLAGR